MTEALEFQCKKNAVAIVIFISDRFKQEFKVTISGP